MKRIAIITPCLLPVPATKGGAIERLISRVIEDNEVYKRYYFDLFTISGSENNNDSYLFTNIISIKSSKSLKLVEKVLDKYHRTFSSNASRVLDSIIVRAFLQRLAELENNYHAVIIVNMMSTACQIVRSCLSNYDFPIYFHMHNDVDMYRSPGMIRELVRHGVQFISVSEYLKRRIISSDEKAQVSTLYNGVNLSLYKMAPKHCTNNSDFLIVYAGRIIPGKGVKELVQAFILFLEQMKQDYACRIKLDIVGFNGFDKSYEASIVNIAKACPNISCVKYLASDKMAELYDDADLVVMPSLVEESFGLVALETMARGIPLIVSNSGALPEVVGNGGYIVDKSNNFVNNLSEAIVEVVCNPSYREQLSKRACERAHSIEAFNIDNYYKRFMEVIDEFTIDFSDVISVIVPVFNVEKYLDRCVTAIIEQSYSNIEVIIIDDGSTDNSGALCDNFASKDTRIKVIHQSNMGLSEARNTGLNMASGKYIFFCDSDDYLQTDCLEKLLRKLKSDHADVVACGFSYVYDDSVLESDNNEIVMDRNPGRWSGRQSVIEMMRHNNVCSVAWNKLYKRSIFEGISFTKGIKNEDEAVVYKILYKAKIVSYTPEALYNYFQRDLSIMHENLVDRYDYYLQSLVDRIQYFTDNNEAELVQHSRISLLEWIKYSFRNIKDEEIKKCLSEEYRKNINFSTAPTVMGLRKKMALLLWKYCRY